MRMRLRLAQDAQEPIDVVLGVVDVGRYANAVIAQAGAEVRCLELFVALLQAYIFTFLSALFIGSAVHSH